MKKKLRSAFQSRQYMTSRDFELFYYDDRNLTKVESHTHNYYEFCFFIEGEVSMQVGKDIYPLHFGDMMLIPPNSSHRAIIHNKHTPYRRFVFWISEDFYRELELRSPYYTYNISHVKETGNCIFHIEHLDFNSLQSKMIRLLEEMQANHFGKDLQIALYVEDLILRINRLVQEKIEPKRVATDTSLYSNLAEYIEEHLEEELTLEKLANVFYVSKYHIAHVFKDNIGLSIHQYITKKRLSLCREAIRSDTNITDVYQAYGFGEYSSFYRAFKKEYGISPKEYRNMQMNLRMEKY